jgi:hypothetical protein
VTGRDLTLAPTVGRTHLAKRAFLFAAASAAVLAVGIVIGNHLVTPSAPSHNAGTEHAAPQARAAQAPGRPATASSAHTRAGAIATAARSITAFGGDVLLQPSRVRAIVERLASATSRTQLTEAFEEASAQTRAKLGADTAPRPVIVLRAAPIGYRVEHYSAAQATIAIWYVGIVGSGATVQLQQSWRTETVDLVWENSSWRVSSFASTAGPTPILAAPDSEPPGELFATIPRFTQFGHAEP